MAGVPHFAARPIVIAHRGASGQRPEHTRAAYELAIDQGADFIEPDLVVTRDGELVVRHENEISHTTDVAVRAEFAGRRTTKTIDGTAVAGWFVEDFTLAELKTLRCRERLPALRPGNLAWDDRDEILTFQEAIDIARAGTARTGRTIGVYPETKHPTYFASLGLPLEPRLAAVLDANGWAGFDAPVFVQSFEPGSLKALADLVDVRAVQLIAASGAPFDAVAAGAPLTYADLITPEGLARVSTWAEAIGPDYALVLPRDADNRLIGTSTLVADAHAVGLVVHPWTVRPENAFLPEDFRREAAWPDETRAHGDWHALLTALYAAGVDGVFADFPNHAVAVRDERAQVVSN